jgi:phosphatidylglycerophosphatase A
MSDNPEAAMANADAAPQPVSRTRAQSKPRFALFIATGAGLGYLPMAPGTFGSLAGLVLAMLPYAAFGAAVEFAHVAVIDISIRGRSVDLFFLLQVLIAVPLAAVGTWTAGTAAKFWGTKDPQRVVIDEVSGQHLTILLGYNLFFWSKPNYFETALYWKYLVLGFILFRVFDIWKPFPARQAESLPGGWGIMADDWVAGIYAAIGLWGARALGL